MNEYAKLLLDPQWQKKRLEILSRDKFSCQMCGSTTNTLHVHHKRYIYGHKPWEYTNFELITLCCDCHEIEKDQLPEALSILSGVVRRFLLSDAIVRMATDLEALYLKMETEREENATHTH